MSEEIKPALTPEEWGEYLRGGPPYLESDPHGLAAAALHSIPHGFTWEDVDALREILREHEGDSFHPLPNAELARLHSLANRIAALLPPKEP